VFVRVSEHRLRPAQRSARAERYAGLAVVLAIFVSACVAGYEAVDRLIDPRDVEHLGALAIAGAAGFAGNWIAAIIRSRAGRRLDSPALVADPLIGLAITIVILRITWDSWRTVRGRDQHRTSGRSGKLSAG
jgi:divalent metal cation (Fe/Co/Zn/Cd) transporter